MKVLIVEDDDEKSAQIARFIKDNFSVDSVNCARSFQSGLRDILSDQPDVIFLDMTMTNFDRTLQEDGGRPHHFAGREILRLMRRSRLDIPVIIVTHFDRFGEKEDFLTLEQLKTELAGKFKNYIGTVRYKSNVDDWKPAMVEIVGEILPARRS